MSDKFIVEKKNYSDQVFDYLFREISNKNLRPGDKLPNERKLSEELGISRPPLREALKAMKAIGLVATNHGSGSYVNEYGVDYIHTILRFLSVCNEGLMLDFIQLRKAIETEAARMAATNASDSQIAEMQAIHEKRKSLFADNVMNVDAVREELQSLDFDFHNVIVKASGNTIFSEFLDAIREALKVHQKYAAMSDGKSSCTIQAHEGLLDAIRRKDPDSAAEIMHKHISDIESAISDQIV